jgi:hypothetical protein
MLDSRTKASGFYRGDAARLVTEAARLPVEPVLAIEPERISEPDPSPAIAAIGAPAVVLDDPQRPLLSPEPPTNQNLRAPRPQPEELEYDEEPPRWKLGRAIAWVLLAPWYGAIAVASVGVDVLFIKDLLGL